ncbi:MAG: [FeFe] hydrogenase H-cluster maturation GTPase HydF [Clostridia bacterium]|nr:[FeFe] hydrogenase H-cluster maturation GTPase HydF [Clostridia bacterium]
MDKLVISILGKINSGKSTLVNSLAREEVSIVSEVQGSTSDSISKMTEIDGLGRVMLIDTAGYDDKSTLSGKRIAGTRKAFYMADLVIIVSLGELDSQDKEWIEECKSLNKKYIVCYNSIGVDKFSEGNFEDNNEIALDVSNRAHTDILTKKIVSLLSNKKADITGDLLKANDTILLCMPQDEGAPTSRLILPQSITIREIIDKGGTPIISDIENFEGIYNKFKNDISLIITDSSVFEKVYSVVGGEKAITSFSILFAKYNGDIDIFINGARQLEYLCDGDKVLIMEACSHTLSHKDIGSVVIPQLIKKYTGKQISFDFLTGRDEPDNWTDYKLVVHCGGCTQNRAFMMSRIQKCQENGVAITNYGILIAKIKGILDKIVY